jgi:hypothetical protein
MELSIQIDDPRVEDVRELLASHLGFSRGVTPIEYSFALDVDQLLEPNITFLCEESGHPGRDRSA